MNTNLQWHNEHDMETGAMQINIAYAGYDFKDLMVNEMPGSYKFTFADSLSHLHNLLINISVWEIPDVLILETDEHEQCFSFIEDIKKDSHLQGIIIVLLSKHENIEWKLKALRLKVHDYYLYPFNIIHLHERIKLLLKLRFIKPYNADQDFPDLKNKFTYKMPVSKRAFDVVASATILCCLSPLMLVVSLLIILESKGPVIYKSRRVGTGYKTFDFYKFRSMQINADAQITEFEQLNLYGQKNGSTGSAIFFKVMNDPRITKVGQFIRNTSIDELPQLFNILIGDMSFVGNRPLPLYEAEKLTSNEWSMRFLGPAGLTGLWQIKQRGKKEVSEQERKELDNYYVSSHSFWLDLEIVLKTIPAIIQKVKV